MADHDDLDDNQFPDNDEFVPYITAGNLAQKTGSKVMCWGIVTKVSGGEGFYIKTVDDQEILIKLRQPLSDPLEGWYEIHGVSQGKSILCEEYIPFPPELTKNVHKDGHKGLARLLASLDNPWDIGESAANGVPME